jgi:hypothetical protein
METYTAIENKKIKGFTSEQIHRGWQAVRYIPYVRLILLGFFRRSSPAVSLSPGCKLPEVIASAFRGHAPALLAEDRGCWHLGLRQEIIGNGHSRTEQFPASCRAVLWEWGCGQDQVCFRNQFLECC